MVHCPFDSVEFPLQGLLGQIRSVRVLETTVFVNKLCIRIRSIGLHICILKVNFSKLYLHPPDAELATKESMSETIPVAPN